ncbi:MAG: FtsX-like permease family protein [Nocardioidaceae bacterium]|nr:FtsX-like permease family protein [Nocardioidaceae bacterium]
MFKVTWHNLIARKLRLALSAFAIVLGVAFVAGSFIFTDALGGAFDGIVKGTTADVEVLPRGAGQFDSFGTDARTIPASLVAELSQLQEAEQVVGTDQVQGVFVISKEGKLIGGNGPPGLAFNYNELTAITGDRILTVADGQLPSARDEVALDVDTADKAGYDIGDEVTLVTPGDPPTMKAVLTGLVRFGSEGGLVGATITVFDDQVIKDLFFDGKDVYTNVSLTAAEGVSQVQLRDAVEGVLPEGLEALTGDDFAADQQEIIGEILGFINTFLLVFAAVALVVGTFLIINTFSILVAQRSRELALLRAMGASKTQVNRAVLAEAFVVSLVGSTVGLGLGYLLAIGLKALFGVIGLDLGAADMPIELRTVLLSYVVGVIVTLIAAYLPARRASRISPVQAMRDDVALAETSLRRRFVLGAVMVAGGVALMVAGFAGSGGRGLLLIGLGMLAILLGVALMAPVLGRPIIQALGSAYRGLFGTVGSLATENTLRNPRRTAATSSALMIGLTLVALMSILGQSAKVSTDKAIEESLTAELIVSNATGQFFSTAYAGQIRELDGVASVTTFRQAAAKMGDSQVYLQAVDPESLGAALQLPVDSGSLRGFEDQSVFVSSTRAKSSNIDVGDSVKLNFPAGPMAFDVAGVFPVGGAVAGDFLLTLEGLQRSGIKPEDSLLFISKEPGASEASVRAGIEDVLADNPTVTLKNQKEFADEQKGLINTVLYIIYALLGLAIIIAILGITNTLALSVIERTREVGLLRAIGVSRRQLRSMVRLESIAISVLGAVLGVVMGIAFGIALQRAIADQGIDVLSIPWPQLGVFVVLAGLVGVLAAVLPARRAAKLNVLDAITTE